MTGKVQALDSEDIKSCGCIFLMVLMVEVRGTVVRWQLKEGRGGGYRVIYPESPKERRVGVQKRVQRYKRYLVLQYILYQHSPVPLVPWVLLTICVS